VAALAQDHAVNPGSGGASPPSVATEPTWVSAISGGDAAETVVTVANQYDPLTLSLTEDVVSDFGLEFTTNANEICYVGAPSPITALVTASLSFDRTSGTGTDTVTLAIGMAATGTIDDGDEVGDPQIRTIDSASVGMGALGASVQMTNTDCIGILVQTDDVAPTFGLTLQGLHLVIQKRNL
jgi:hypothetical protein